MEGIGMEHLKDKESKLEGENCATCKGETLLSTEEIESLNKALESGWKVINGHHLRRRFKFRTFQEALEFANRVGDVSEEQGHHPTITVGWGQADVEIYTHALDGLSRSDFILASKISRIVRQTYVRDRYVATD